MADPYSAPLMPGISNQALESSSNYGAGASPFFSTANQYMPRNLKDILKWVRYITVQSPVTTEVLRKLATFPITDFTYSSDQPSVVDKYRKVVESTELKQTLHNVGYQYHTSGNVFISLYLPFIRTLTCKSCTSVFKMDEAEGFAKFQNYSFFGTCPKCGQKGEFLRKETASKNHEDMNVVLWDPLNIVVNHNPISGKSVYYYQMPNEVKRQVQAGNFLFLSTLPWEFVEAIQQNKDFRFDSNRIFHLKNIDTGFSANGVSVPPMVSHFGLVFYQASLRKANEAIAQEFMSPIRVVFPQPVTSSGDPVVAMSMKNFTARMEDVISKSKRDKALVAIAPMPIGYQPISGEGKTLLVAQEIQAAEESLLLSLGVSRELLSGTTNWTSSTVGLRMLKNTLDSYVGQITRLLKWISDQISDYFHIGACQIGLTPFQLTDDDNLKNVLLSLAQGQEQRVSLTTLYQSMGRSYSEELDRIVEDEKAKARADVKAQFEVAQAKYLEATKLRSDIPEDAGYMDILQKAQGLISELSGAPPQQVTEYLNALMVQDYGMYILVSHMMTEMNSQPVGQQGQDPNQDPNQAQSGNADPNSSKEPGSSTSDPKPREV